MQYNNKYPIMNKNLSIILLTLSLFALWFYIFFPRNQVVPIATPIVKIVSSPSPLVVEKRKTRIQLDVPFIAQAPTGMWSDPRLQDGCEEAVSYMAYLWATKSSFSKNFKEQEAKLLEISDWEESEYGSYHDTNTFDTTNRILKGYFKYNNVEVVVDITIDDIKNELSNGNLIIVPTDGRKLKNPYFSNGGPERHNLVIKGYDDESFEFITNDNGTRRGEGYKYKQQLLYDAIGDYPTGDHLPLTNREKTMIIVRK